MTAFAAPAEFAPSRLQPGAIGAWECRFPGDLLSWTEGVYAIFGFRHGERIHRADMVDLYEERSRLEMNRLRSEAIATGRPFSLDCRLRAADGRRRWMRLVLGVEHRHGRTARIFGSKQDITAEKGLWADLAQAAEPRAIASDSLLRGLEDAWRRFAERPGGLSGALVIFALDDHGLWQERSGVAAARSVHAQVDQRIGRLFPDALMRGCLAEGAFVLLLPVSQDRQRLAATLEGARQLLRRPLQEGRALLDFRLSAGAAMAPPAGGSDAVWRLMAGAEAGLKAARLQGGDQLRLFDGPLSGPFAKALPPAPPAAETGLRRA